jgi:hypothetical protein
MITLTNEQYEELQQTLQNFSCDNKDCKASSKKCECKRGPYLSEENLKGIIHNIVAESGDSAKVQLIPKDINHNPYATRQKVLTWAGRILSFVFALACGLTTAAAVLGMHIATGGLSSIVIYCIAGGAFVFGTGANMRMCYGSIPQLFVDLFGKGRLFAGLGEEEVALVNKDGTTVVDKDGQPIMIARKITLSRKQKLAMGISAFLAVSVGVMFGALAYVSAIALPATFAFLGIVSVALPPVGIALGAITVVILAGLMFKAMADEIKKGNLISRGIKAVKDIFDLSDDLPMNKDKSYVRRVFEHAAIATLILISLPLVLAGLVLTMINCTHGFGNTLMQIPGAIPRAVDIASKVIGLGLATAGQIPFSIKSSINAIKSMFAAKNDEKKSAIAQFVAKALLVTSLSNAVGNGFVAGNGASGNSIFEIILKLIGIVGGFFGSYFSTAGNDADDGKNRNAERVAGGSSAKTLNALKEAPAKSNKSALDIASTDPRSSVTMKDLNLNKEKYKGTDIWHSQQNNKPSEGKDEVNVVGNDSLSPSF